MRKFAAILAVLSWVISGCVDDVDNAVDCREGQIKCNGSCIDPNISMDYCGATADCSGDNAGSKCTSGQTCSAGTCIGGGGGPCTTNICSNGKIQICTGGTLGAAANCSGEASCKSATECGECKNGSLDCNGSKVKICVNGAWTEGANCEADNKICAAGTCIEAALCQTNICADGKIQICGEDNKLQSEKPCDGGADCKSASECGECKTGIIECHDTQIMICETGVWKEEADCAADNKICSGGECIEAASCETNICADGKIQICGDDNKLQSEKTCDGGADCKSASECGECSGAATVCAAGMIQTCSGGVLGAAVACAAGADCSSATACGNCSGSAFTCSGAILQQCVGGVTTTIKTCGTGTACHATAGDCLSTAECVEDTFECIGTGGYRLCIDGTWEPDTCTGSLLCLASAERCVECLTVGEKSCLDDETVQICDSSNAWDIDELCAPGFVCSATAKGCVEIGDSYSIDYAKTLGYNADTDIMWGEVYSADIPANGILAPPAEMLSQIVCTTNIANALSTWTVVANAAFTGKWTGTGNNNYEFSGKIAPIAEDAARYCLMRFSGDDGITWSYATSGGSTLLSGTDILSDSSQAFLVAKVLLAFWNFDSKTLTQPLAADAGKITGSTFSLVGADGSLLTLVDSNTPAAANGGYAAGFGGGTGNWAITAQSWSTATGWNAANRHFRIDTSTTGYKDIKVTFNAYGSATGAKTVSVIYSIGGGTLAQFGDNLVWSGTTWQEWLGAVPADANNASSVVIRLQPHSFPATGTTFRVDNVTVTGLPL